MKSKNLKVKAILWDLDGVLIDTEHIHAENESKAAKHFGIDISPEEVIRLYSGVKIEKEIQDMERRFKKRMPVDEALVVLRPLLEKKVDQGISTIPYAKNVLKNLGKKYKMALVTSSMRFFVNQVISKLVLAHFFEAQVLAEDVKKHKPFPDSYLLAAKNLRVEPEEAVVIEDSEPGFEAVKAAGMLLIARKADHNKNKDFSLADYVVTDLREIPKILDKLSN